MISLNKNMAGRQRFVETMRYGSPDRVPYFEEGIRKNVLRIWRQQGMPRNLDLKQRFPTDPRIEIETQLDPRKFRWPITRDKLTSFRNALNPGEAWRLPKKWSRLVRTLRKNDCIRMLKVHRGLFLSMGVKAWNGFYDLMMRLALEPDVVREAMHIQGEFAAALADRILSEIEIDAAIFSEPIGGNNRPLISPAMYEDIVLQSYAPILQILRKYGIQVIIFRTYANARVLIPKLLAYGFNCLWACEVNIEDMDYRALRKEYGKDLRLIGGIDLDALRFGKDDIDREIRTKLPWLLQQGGYVPLADGRVREDVPFENYRYYRELLQEVTQSAGG